MSNEEIEQLKEQFETIRDERRTFANTATRIGNAFLALLNFLRGSFSGAFLRKDQDDSTNFFITFLKGIKFGNFTTGALGTGGAITVDQETGDTTAEFDFLTIRKAATFRSITILELKHIGGELGITAGAMKVSRVEELENAYRCYFDTTDGKRRVYQEFIVGDQARCQAFRLQPDSNGTLRTKYYWRLVVGVSTGNNADEGYVDLSKTECDANSSVPEEGDEVIQLGYRPEANPLNELHPERQSAIILSAVANDAPSQKFYQGINSFNLDDKFVKDEGYDHRTGFFHCNIYGNFFVGDKGADPSNFMKYDSEHNLLEISGRVKMTAGSTIGNENLQTLLTTIDGKADAAGGAAADAQTTADQAQTTADQAQTAAGQAQTTADQAQTAASNAQDSADAAGSAATNAQNSADTVNGRVNNLSTGNENLIVNGGFSGLYTSESVENLTLSESTEIFSDPFGRWDVHSGCTIVLRSASATGKACQMTSGRLEQTVTRGIISGQEYTLSFLALSTGSVDVSIGGYTESIALTSGTRIEKKFSATSTESTLVISGSGIITEIQLIQGNLTLKDWIPSPEDNNKYLSYYKNLAYLMEAISDGSTDIIGGLILTMMIRVGNYINKQMVAETGGMSGIFNDENSPFLWGGGNMEAALRTIATFTNDPSYNPTPVELSQMAKFVVTHGGQAFLNNVIARGFIYATSGIFKNITSPNGKFNIDENGNMNVRDATISGDMYAPLFILTDSNFSQYTEQIAPNNYRLLLDKTGLNVQISVSNYSLFTLALPNDSKYNGAILRIYNNTWRRVTISNVVTKYSEVVGTFHATINDNDVLLEIGPYSYAMYQCEFYNIGDAVISKDNYKLITKETNLQKVADVSVGDRLKIVGGIQQGDDGYKVYGGTSPSSANIRFHDSTIDTSLTVKERVAGFNTDYVVSSSPSCTAIYANVDYDDTTAFVCVFKMNTQEFYGWKNMDENVEDYGFPTPFTQAAFYNPRGEISQGSFPYIDEHGILRFTSWTRQDRDGAIHVDG